MRLHKNNVESSLFGTKLNFSSVDVSVVGCADIVAPEGAWVERTEESATVRCNETGETWYLVCKDVQWLGALSNCTKGESDGDHGT